MNGLVAWLGLSGPDSIDDEGRVPTWYGVDSKRKAGTGLLCLIAAVIMFAAMQSVMPDADGLGGLAPLVIAVLFYVAISQLSERVMLRVRPDDRR